MNLNGRILFVCVPEYDKVVVLQYFLVDVEFCFPGTSVWLVPLGKVCQCLAKVNPVQFYDGHSYKFNGVLHSPVVRHFALVVRRINAFYVSISAYCCLVAGVVVFKDTLEVVCRSRAGLEK